MTALTYHHRPSILPASYALVWLNLISKVQQLLTSFIKEVSQYHRSEDEIKEEYQIILKCQKDPKHFAPIYERYYESIYVFINKRVDEEEVTADLAARVFYNCLKNIGKYRYQGVPFSAWLFKIAINEVNLYFRGKNKTERTVSLDEGHIDILIEEIDYTEPEIDRHILISVLLEQLSDQEVQFLELRFFENCSFKEMGYLLGLSEVNAKVKTYRILKKLRTIAAQIKYH
ncbi:MAG: sigma-70 family RNA polymerase sigma factor [Bacteroidota bacterium]